jgi:hypothetical protein
MTALKELRNWPRKVASAANELADGYSAGADRPLGGYLTTMSAYTCMVGALTGAAALSGREIPADGLSPQDTLLVAVATHKISRLITKDPATSPLRAPFTTYAGAAGPAEVAEKASGRGVREAVGELVSSPLAADLWVATGLTAGLVFRPRVTRLVMSTFAALAGADLLQVLYARLETPARRPDVEAAAR